MHRIEGANNTKDSEGRLIFQDGPPATTLPAAWLNSVQEEIANVIEQTGVNLLAANNDTRNQLYTALVNIVGTEVASAALGEFIEVTTGATAAAGKNYVANRETVRAEITVPTGFGQGNYVAVYGKANGGWIIDLGNYIFYGYKKLLISSQYNDSIRLIWIDNNRVKVDYHDSQKLTFYGFYAGGDAGGFSNVIDNIDLTVLSGNAADRGDLTVARKLLAGVSGIQYGFYGGGDDAVAESDVIDYIDMTLTSGNATDRGDLTVARQLIAGVSGIQYGFFGGGYTGVAASNIIDYIDMTLTSGNAADRGDLTVARSGLAGVSGIQYGFYGGGLVSRDNIDYIDQTVLSGNATDRGDLTVGRYGLAGVSGIQYGFYAGGYDGSFDYDVIDYIDMTLTSGNASDRGDLTVGRYGLAGVSGIQYGFYGGETGNDVIDYIDMTLTSGNATDRGDLTVGRGGSAGV